MAPIIYALIDPQERVIRYIGATRTPLHRRIGRHVSSAYAGKRSPVAEWLRDVGWPHSVVLERLPRAKPEHILERESRWIALLREQGVELLNAIAPGLHRHWDDDVDSVNK